jgi:hypothetical protein
VSPFALVTLDNGDLNFRGNAVAATTQGMGTLRLGANSGGNAITFITPAPMLATLTAGTFSQSGGDLLVRGSDLGGRERLRFTTAPADAGGALLAGVFTANGGSTVADALAIYDRAADAKGEIGVRALRTEEMTRASDVRNPANGGTVPTSSNLLLTSPTTASGPSNTVNSITFEESGSLALGPEQKLTIASGMMLVRSGSTRLSPVARSISGAVSG